MPSPQDDLLSWSLFALTPEDIDALTQLSRSSILCPPNSHELDVSNYEIQAGRRIALSLKSTDSNTYNGLCVFGLESPSPAGDKAIALHVLSLDRYPAAPDRIRGSSRTNIDAALFNEVKRFCVTHGYTRIHCFVPADPDTLALLTRLGFETEGVTLGGQPRTFSLTRHLAPTYTGDPYDGRHLLNWIADQLQFEAIDTTDTTCRCVLRLGTLNPDFADTALGLSQLPVFIELQPLEQGKDYLRIGLGSNEPHSVHASLSFHDLRQLAGVPRLDMTLWPPPAEGASIAVEIRSDLYSNFSLNGQHAYFDSGSYGTLLEYSIEHGVAPQIFFVDFATTTTNPRLIGVGRIVSVHRGSPEDLWANWGSISSWPDAAGFARYRAIKRKMTVIVFDQLRRVDIIGAGLPSIGHSWTYVPARQAYGIARLL